jgi:hypothetical protein
MTEEMSLEPAIAMCWILEEFQVIHLKGNPAIARVDVSS